MGIGTPCWPRYRLETARVLIPGHPVKEMISRAHQSTVRKDRTFQHVQNNTAGSDVPRNAKEGDTCANNNPKTGPPLVLQG